MTEMSLHDAARPTLELLAGEDVTGINSRLLWDLYAPMVKKLTDPDRVTTRIHEYLDLMCDPDPDTRRQPAVLYNRLLDLTASPRSEKGADISALMDDIETRIETSSLYRHQAHDYSENDSWQIMDYGRQKRAEARALGYDVASVATIGEKLMLHATLLRWLPEINSSIQRPLRGIRTFNENAMFNYRQRFILLSRVLFDQGA